MVKRGDGVELGRWGVGNGVDSEARRRGRIGKMGGRKQCRWGSKEVGQKAANGGGDSLNGVDGIRGRWGRG